MATRYQTYQMSWGFLTIDTEAETPPDDFIAGPFDVNLTEAGHIQDGASIEIVDGQAIVTPQENV